MTSLRLWLGVELSSQGLGLKESGVCGDEHP